MRNKLEQSKQDLAPLPPTHFNYLPSPLHPFFCLTPHPRSRPRAPRRLDWRKFLPTCATAPGAASWRQGWARGRRLLGARPSRPCGPGLLFKRAGPAPTAPHRGDQDTRLFSRSIFISPSVHVCSPPAAALFSCADYGEPGHAARSASRPPGSHDDGGWVGTVGRSAPRTAPASASPAALGILTGGYWETGRVEWMVSPSCLRFWLSSLPWVFPFNSPPQRLTWEKPEGFLAQPKESQF